MNRPPVAKPLMAARRHGRSALVTILFFLLVLPPPSLALATATAATSDAEAGALLTLLLGGPSSTAAVLAGMYATPPRPLRVADAARTGRAAWARTRRTWVAREDVDALLVPNVSVASGGGGPLRLGDDVTFARPHSGAGGVCERLDVTRMGPAVAAEETAVPLAAAHDLVATGYAMTVSAVHLRDAAVHRAAVGCLRRAFGVAVTADVTLQPPAVTKLEAGCAAVRDVPSPDAHTLVVQLDGERTVLLHPPPSPMPRFGGENAPPLPGLGGSDSESDEEDGTADRTYTLTEGDVLSVPAGWVLTSATPRDKVSLSLSYRVATPAATVGTLLRELLAGVSTAPLRGAATSESLAAAAVEVAAGVSPALLGTPIMPTTILRRAAAWVEGEGDDAPATDGWGDTHEDPHLASLTRAVETFCNAASAELLSPLLAELAEGIDGGEEAGAAVSGVGPGGANGEGGGPADDAGGAFSSPSLPLPSLLGPNAAAEERDLRVWAAGVVGRGRSAAAASVFEAILREMADADVVAAVAAIAAADREAAAAVAGWEGKMLAAHARGAARETEKDL